MRVVRAIVLRAVVLVAVASIAIYAQQTTGAIRGLVADPSGASIPNVTVTATNTDTGAMQATKTGAGGNYVLPLLPPGRYEISAETAGFSKSLRSDVLVRITETEVVDFSLQLGSVAESVTVAGAVSLVQANQRPKAV